MKKCAVLFVLIGAILFVSCASSKKSAYHPLHKMAPAALQSDLHLLKAIFENNHPSLHWYTPKDSIDYFFAQVNNSITDSLTELQYRNRLSWLLNKIHCGHTQVRFSKQYSKFYTGKRLPQFPLLLKAWNDTLVVINNFLKDSVIKRGMVITSINSISNKVLLDSMYALVSGDGYTNNFKQQLVSFYFPQYFKTTFGIDSSYTFTYKDSIEKQHTITQPYYKPISDSLEKSRIAGLPKLSRRETRKYRLLSQRNLQIDTADCTAILNINTFSEGKLQRFFKTSFKKIQDQQLQHVVIDLRQNSGGNIFSSIRLMQFLTDRPFKVADTVAGSNRNFKYKRYMRPWLIYWLSMHISGRKEADERIHFRYFERHVFKPKSKHHFNGSVYLLTGGYTFSAASLVASHLKGQSNITIVGEETGGGAYGNTAVHLPVITLPQSKVRVVMPLYRMVFDASRQNTGRGVIPDVQVSPSSRAIRAGIDLKMQKVKELIKSSNKSEK